MAAPVFAAPGTEPGLADKAAYSLCVMKHPHGALRRRDVYARSGDRWGDPRAKLLAGQWWESVQPTILTALGLEAEPAAHGECAVDARHAGRPALAFAGEDDEIGLRGQGSRTVWMPGSGLVGRHIQLGRLAVFVGGEVDLDGKGNVVAGPGHAQGVGDRRQP